MAMTTEEATALVASALAISTQLATLIPQLEANTQAVKTALADADDADLATQIDTLHAQSQQLTAQLTALRS
jgi:uncharacterized protein YlxW (UPF0749 family)